MDKLPNFMKAVVVSCVVLGVLFGYVVYDTLMEDKEVRSWKTVMKWVPGEPLAEADPGAGNSGILEVFFINHTADHFYAVENSSAVLEGHCTTNGLGFATADDSQIDLAHSTDFDIVVRIRANATHAKHGAVWFDSDVNVTITWSDGGESDAQPDGKTTSGLAAFNTSDFDFLYVNFYWDDSGGSGYSISKGQTSEIASIEFAAYF